MNGAHFAERYQGFVLIALGESIVVIGGLARLDHPALHDIVALVVCFGGAVALWWVYFDHAAEDSSHVIEESEDPGHATVAWLVLGVVAPHVSALTLGLCTTAVVLCVIIADRILHPAESLEDSPGDVASVSG